MKDLQEFIERMVKIEFIEQSNCFGHYPFQMFVENQDGSNGLMSLALGGKVKSCYIVFANAMENMAQRVYLSLDFPAGGDIQNDFVCVMAYENGKLNAFAIPYNNHDGQILERIENSLQVEKILQDFRLIVPV